MMGGSLLRRITAMRATEISWMAAGGNMRRVCAAVRISVPGSAGYGVSDKGFDVGVRQAGVGDFFDRGAKAVRADFRLRA